MRASLCNLLCLAVIFRAVASDPHPGKVAPTFESDPPFHHRSMHSAIVLGNYLYIDGGEITTWNGVGSPVQTSQTQNGTKQGDIISLPSNWTYSIDLTSSWTNRSVLLNPIYKDSPPLNREALWLLDDKVYQYDGSKSPLTPEWYNSAPDSDQFWQFHPSGDSGHWTQQTVATPPDRPPLVEVDQAYYASGNGIGFAVGGVESDSTYYGYTSGTYDWRRVPGLVMYNDTSGEWFNASTKDLTYNGLAIQGAAHFVPIFGPEGLLLTFGGLYATEPGGEPDIPITFDYVYIFEPVSKQWQKQKVTGSYPSVNTNQCMVGSEGDDGTYEIFMYGGTTPGSTVEDTVNLGAVWVLSLPSFHWERQPDPLSFGRWYHSCQVAGTNNRQMISVGGMVAKKSIDQDDFSYGTVDPWDQGIGVFDMSEMEWKTSFDANTAAYITPSIIKEYLNGKQRYAAWSNDVIEEWFVKQARYTRSSSGGSGSGPTSTGAIAGGVVGGVAGLAIICAIVLFIRFRRRRREREAAWNQVPQGETYFNYPKEMDSNRDRAELAAKRNLAEHAGSPIHELEGRGKSGG